MCNGIALPALKVKAAAEKITQHYNDYQAKVEQECIDYKMQDKTVFFGLITKKGMSKEDAKKSSKADLNDRYCGVYWVYHKWDKTYKAAKDIRDLCDCALSFVPKYDEDIEVTLTLEQALLLQRFKYDT